MIGYDIGSSSIKAALVNVSGEVIVVVSSPGTELDIIARQSGWAEQHPDIWWKHVCIATHKLLKDNDIDSLSISSIGISYQMHGLVLVDHNLQAIRPAIIWCDSRASGIGEEAFDQLGKDYCLKNLLNSPGNFTASKLKWVKDNEPDLYSKIYKVMLPGDYIAMRLSGEVTTTIGGLSEAVLWNFKTKSMAVEVLDNYGINADLFPRVIPVFSNQLRLSKAAAKEIGLSKSTIVSYRAGDQPNNAMSLNVLHPGEIAATSGTSGVVYGVVDELNYDEDSRINSFTHVNYESHFDRIGVLLCINGAGIQYAWLKNQIARSDQSYEDMERMIASVPVGSEGVCVLPFGNGAERMFNNKNLESHIFNLEFNRHTRAHLYRASIEGVAFSFVYGINILKEMGMTVDKIKVGNDNMFQSKVFASTIATLLDTEIAMYDTTGAIGAARASGVGVGLYQSLEEAMDGFKPFKVYQPSLNLGMCHQAYNYWLSSLTKIREVSKDTNRKIKVLQHQCNSLGTELKSKSQKIISQGIQIDKLKAELQIIKAKLIENKDEIIQNDVVQSLSKYIDQITKSANTPSDAENNLKYLNTPFVNKLNTAYPILSFEELKLCYFIVKKMTNKEISDVMSLTVRGVETKRYRLRKKLVLERSQKIETILQSYLEE